MGRIRERSGLDAAKTRVRAVVPTIIALSLAALVAWTIAWLAVDSGERSHVVFVQVIAALAISGLLAQFVVHRSLMAPLWWLLRCAPLVAAAIMLGSEALAGSLDSYAWASGGAMLLAGVGLLVQGVMERNWAALDEARTIARRNREMFDHAPAALFEIDLSGAWQWLVKHQLIDRTDEVRRWFDEGRPATSEALSSIVVRDVNFAAVRLVGKTDRAAALDDTLLQGAWRSLVEALAKRTRVVECELDVAVPSGNRKMILRAELPGPADLEHCLVYIVDVTEQRRLEEQVRASQRLESMGKLAGGVAHDFNNLLTIVRLAADRLRRPLLGRAAEESPETNIIIDAVSRASSLTRQLMLFSRREVSNPKRFVPNEVIEDLTALLRRTMQSIELTIELDPKLGAVEMDPSQLEQLVLNLAINARDAMPDGGKLRVTTKTRRLRAGEVHGIAAGTYASIVVTDTGTGMDEATRARVFEPFFTTKPAGKGTGLGLSIVYGIARNAGGGVAIESEPGRGTSVEVLLPQVASSETLVRPPRTGELPLGRGEHIFFVEDEDALRITTQKTLEDAGYKVIAVRNGPEAIKALAQDRPVDLLISDVVMPVMGGRELLERVRTTRPDLHVLFTSGYMTGVDREQNLANAHFLAKPYTVGQLLMSVSAALRNAPSPAATTPSRSPPAAAP